MLERCPQPEPELTAAAAPSLTQVRRAFPADTAALNFYMFFLRDKHKSEIK